MKQTTPGFYGKLPQFGDFISRRLPRPFVDAWDQWLQSAILASREQLGDKWLDSYLVSPVWRFALSPGLADDSAWAGILMPSVDRVGRYFPFLIATPVSSGYCLTYLFELGRPWFDELEHLALSCLEDGFDLTVFDHRLQDLRFPGVLETSRHAPEVGVAGHGGKYALHVELTDKDRSSSAYIGMAGCLLEHFLPRHSLWCDVGPERSASVIVCDGLPPIDAYAALLTGQWDQRGWAIQTHKVPLPPQIEAFSSPPRGVPLLQGGNLGWRSHAISVVGHRRQRNEDALLERPDIGLWAVADGMGGHQAGEVASQAIIDALAQVRFGQDHATNVASVRSRLCEVNKDLNAMAEARSTDAIIGSTVVVLVASAKQASFVWAGDSRLYRLRTGILEQLTTDHSVQADEVTHSFGRNEFQWPPSSAITRAVGADIDLKLEQAECEILPGDKFLLCSDGLDKELKGNEIRAILDAGDFQTAAEVLIDNALERGARDNVTVIVVQINE